MSTAAIAQRFHFDFMGSRFIWVGISLVAMAISIYVWFSQGQDKYGVDFVGGVEIVARFESGISAGDLRDTLSKGGFANATVQNFENNQNEYTIRLKANHDTTTADKLRDVIKSGGHGNVEIVKQDFVGPIIGEQIRKDGIWAVALSLIGILIYVSVRFEWRFAMGAVLALAHDIPIVVGASLLAHIEINAATLAAVLTILGYSINDTIVVFDRIRENYGEWLSKHPSGKLSAAGLMQIMNDSVNQTLSRTILTSLTTLIASLALWLYGGGAVSDLAFAMVVGIISGTYSSIFVACPFVLALQKA